MQRLWTGNEMECAQQDNRMCAVWSLPWHKEASWWTMDERSAMRMSDQRLATKSGLVIIRGELRKDSGRNCSVDTELIHWVNCSNRRSVLVNSPFKCTVSLLLFPLMIPRLKALPLLKSTSGKLLLWIVAPSEKRWNPIVLEVGRCNHGTIVLARILPHIIWLFMNSKYPSLHVLFIFQSISLNMDMKMTWSPNCSGSMLRADHCGSSEDSAQLVFHQLQIILHKK